MANQFVSLPVPIGNGVGAAVDVSTFGASKSIVVGGNATARITIEVNNDPATLGGWAALRTFQDTGELVINVACMWMRVRVSNYNSYAGGAPVVDVGGDDGGALFAALGSPVGNGVGANVNTTALGLFKTVQVGGAYRGAVIVEVSEDGSEWAQPFAFGSQSPGIQSLLVTAEFMRVRRVGVPKIDPGIPIVNVGAADFGGGGGGSGVDVERDGAVVVAGATILDFIGTRVTNAGGGQADITPAVIFDSAVGTPDVNIRSSRLTDQSPIDNTQTQITNLGSADGLVDPAAVGATGKGSTIGGGNDNSASGDYSTVPGGAGNAALGDYSQAEGLLAQATNPGERALGGGSFAPGLAQTSELVLRGVTFGNAPGTVVTLLFDAATPWAIPADTAWALKIWAVAGGTVGEEAPAVVRASFEFATVLIYDEGGALSLLPTDPITITPIAADPGDAQNWTMTLSIQANVPTLVLTTGVLAGFGVRVAARMQVVAVTPLLGVP